MIYNKYYILEKMENQLSINSADCICCREKDKIIEKYKKLVEKLKNKAKKCNTNTLYAIKTARTCANRQVLQEIVNQLGKPKQLGFFSKKNSLNSGKIFEQSTLVSEQNKEKLVQTMMQQSRSRWRLSQFSNFDLMQCTAPAALSRGISLQTPKKISLTGQWQSKFHELSQTISQKNAIISQLQNKIEQMNSCQMYTRSVFLNLLKSMNLQSRSTQTSNQSKDIINLILHMFEYSQEEVKNMFGEDAVKVVEVQEPLESPVSRRGTRVSLVR